MGDDRLQTAFERFRALHAAPGAFVMPNPWDAGSALILEALGFPALATTSAGYGFTIGRRDSVAAFTRDEIIDNARAIACATTLPVSADLEEGFGPDPHDCAATIHAAIKAGLVGGSIEDTTGDPDKPILDIGLAVERIAASVEASRDQPFILTARAEGHLWGQTDLGETITRLQAFSNAGADVLYAPGLPDLAAICTLCAALDKPVNVVMGLQAPFYSVEDLAEAGVKRISVGGSFARAALGGLVRAAREVMQRGTFTYADDALPAADISAMLWTQKPTP